MANWTKTDTVERVEGEIVNDGKENQTQTPNGNTIEPEEKKKGFFETIGGACASVGRAVWHAPTWAKVAVASAFGLGTGYLIAKFTGQEQEDTQEFIPVRIDWTDEEVHEIPEIPEMPAVEEIADAEEISAATERLSDAVEQIIAPATEAMEVTTE